MAESGKVVKGIKISGEATIKKFEAVKAFLGLENDSEVVRFLINDFLRRHRIAENRRNGSSLIDADADVEVFEGG